MIWRFCGRVLLSLIVAVAAYATWPAHAQDRLVINTTSAEPLANAEQTGFHDLLTIEAFSRIGIEIEIERLPGERSLINLNTGIDDGTVVRIAGLEKPYPNVRRVPEAIMRWDFVAFSRDKVFETTDWNSLEPYDVAFINGWKILESNVTAAKSITKVKDSTQLFTLLANDRTDVVIFERWEGLHMQKSLSLEGLRMLEPPLASPEMYMYVHKKHEHLAPQIASALRQMKQDGTYQKIFDRTLAPLQSD